MDKLYFHAWCEVVVKIAIVQLNMASTVAEGDPVIPFWNKVYLHICWKERNLFEKRSKQAPRNLPSGKNPPPFSEIAVNPLISGNSVDRSPSSPGNCL